MKILALEPYYGGSHKALLDGIRDQSRHEWTVLGLPAHKWKWRMRHAAVTLAEQVNRRTAGGESFDALFCSDMLNLAEFRGLVHEGSAHESIGRLPSVVYFHENQLTYPVRHEDERDLHFALTNWTTALAADEVWFNSAFHRDSFLEALVALLARMPDHRHIESVQRIRAKSSIQPPPIDLGTPRSPRTDGPLRILWAARWEHDKNPQTLFEALELLITRGVDFRISVIGEQFRDVPPIFESAKERFARQIDRWGYQPCRSDYEAALAGADVVVSTAIHEFFGISVVEAIAAGAYPLLPERLAYPEILAPLGPDAAKFFYDGDAGMLAERLEILASRVQSGHGSPSDLWQGDP
ncbi:MAG TPA: DUF3524 domain-containing protein, partial [Thermoguttaceae bacterium]|nr:DUF3524 domain-containing protein [Thermoguttaceae bacterium]